MTEQPLQAVEPQPPKPPSAVDKYIATYIMTRRAIADMKAKHEEELKGLVDLQESLTGWLLGFLEKLGPGSSAKTKHGTVYSSTRYSAKLADADAFMKFIIANDRLDLLDRRANAPQVAEYVKENDALPPGVNLSAIRTVGVRAPSKGGSK